MDYDRVAKLFLMVLLSGILTLPSTGCTTPETKDTMKGVRDTLEGTVKMSQYYEDCMELHPGQGMEYFFEASKPVNFNIHYHVESDIFYPVKKDNVSTLKGIFQVEKKQYYCVMWTSSHPEPISLTYKCKVLDR